MRNVNHCVPLGLEPADNLKQSLDVLTSDAARRFVEDENAAADGESARNLDELLLGHGELARRRCWVNLGMMKLPKNVLGLCAHFGAAHDAVSRRLHAKHNVLL